MNNYRKFVLTDVPNETAAVYGNNKFYEMWDLGDGTMKTRYGRIGKTSTEETHPISRWDELIRRRVKKGYTDVTHLVAVETSEVEITAEDPQVKDLINHLYRASKGVVSKTYSVSAGAVTQAMLDEAQAIIDNIATIDDLDKVKRYVIDLYRVIPRIMETVVVPGSVAETARFIQREQDRLEALRGQVVTQTTGDKSQILDVLGITIEAANRLALPGLAPQRVFKVNNPRTESVFMKDLETTQLYHGSRDGNWLSILQSGLQIRPAANGTNFGNGIYFADNIAKSKQYTQNYIGVYDVAVGRVWSANYRDSGLALGRFDGDTVKGRIGSYNEYIIFRPQQCTIRWLLQF